MLIAMSEKKRPGRKPRPDPEPKTKPHRTGVALTLWVRRSTRDAIDRFRAQQRVRPSTTDVVELAILEFLQREGVQIDPALDAG